MNLWLLLGTVGAVLLIACANVGNLMLVRTMGRYREAGVRLALGATRTRLFALVLQEALVLVSLGGIFGLTLAYVGLRLFVASAPVDLPRLGEVQVNWQVFMFSGVAVAFSTIAFGLLPAWRLARTQPLDSLRAGSTNSTEARKKLRARELIVALEVALTTVLLIIGGLLMLSLLRVMQVDTGFGMVHIITQDVSFLNPKYARGGRRRFVEEIVAKLAGTSGVQAAGAINQLPLRGEDWVSGIRDPNEPERRMEDVALANFCFVSPGYWAAMGISLKQGRFLDESDKGRLTTVISERAAHYLWPGQTPLGKQVRGAGPQPPSLEVVGVVGNVRADVEHDPPMTVYEHYWRMQPIGMSFVVRSSFDPVLIINSIRRILSSADPEMAIAAPRTMEQIFNESVANKRYETSLMSAFALSALLLASLGIFGLISFTVARRTPEMGIRIALGASRGGLMTMIIRQGMVPVVLGLTAGLGCAWLLGRVLGSELYGVAPTTPIVFVTIALALLGLGIGACWIPARRISRIDPAAALRSE